MNIRIAKSTLKGLKGLTLIELTAAMIIGLILASAGLILLRNQIFYYRVLETQRFVAEDGPIAANLLSRTLNKADRFLIYPNITAAKTGTGAVIADGEAIVLTFKNPNGTVAYTMIGMETVSGTKQLGVYQSSTATAWTSAANWTITKQISDAEFWVENGVLRCRLTGKEGGQLIFSGSSQF